MQRYTALWVFPVLSIVLVAVMTIRGTTYVDAPAEPPVLSPAGVASLREQRANLDATLAKSVAARKQLEQHVAALHDELTELRASRTAIVAEAKLWRDSYEVLAERFDQLAELTRAQSADGGAEPVEASSSVGVMPASFALEGESVPRPLGAIIVR
ncbi:MAG: hypothetical protein R3F49_13010 [Planctomycetota bacterium]